MSREIKFRFWTGLSMINHTELLNDKYTIAQLSSPLYTPMQFTGLKDKNGVDIYEGDRLDNGWEISFKDGMFGVFNEGTHMGFNNYMAQFREVIGNIYE